MKNTTTKPRKRKEMSRSELHKSYWLGIGWGLFIFTMAWNYTSTWELNAWAAERAQLTDQVKLAQIMAENASTPELLPPPVESGR
jgi:hypothetical protein